MTIEAFLAVAAAALLALSVCGFYLNREVLNPKGIGAYKITSRILRRFGLIRGFKVLTNIKVGGVVIENMLIGYFGILIVRTLGAKAEFYGTLDGDSWSLVIGGKKETVDNPVKQLQAEAAALRGFFSGKKVYNIPVETVVYLPSKSSKFALYITNNGEILTAGKLSAYLNTTKFEKDTGLDINKITGALLEQ